MPVFQLLLTKMHTSSIIVYGIIILLNSLQSEEGYAMILKQLMEIFVPYIRHSLEIIGVLIITFTSLKTFIHYASNGFDISNDIAKIELARALSLSLMFLLSGEILATLSLPDTQHLYIIMGIVVIRVAITYMLHWEIHSDMANCNSFKNLKEEMGKKTKKSCSK